MAGSRVEAAWIYYWIILTIMLAILLYLLHQADTMGTSKSMMLRDFLSKVWAEGVLVLANLEKDFEERMLDHTYCLKMHRNDALAPKLFYWDFFGKKTMFKPVSNTWSEQAIMFVPAHNYKHALFHSAVDSLAMNACKLLHSTMQELKILKVVVGFCCRRPPWSSWWWKSGGWPWKCHGCLRSCQSGTQLATTPPPWSPAINPVLNG